MKASITLFLIFSLVNLYSQDVMEVDFGTDLISFENPAEYKYLLLDTNDIWTIGNIEKDILFLPDGGNAMFTDTNQYYRVNLSASVQFRLYFEAGFNAYALSFWHKYDFEEGIDGGKIETSYDNGISWQNILLDPDIQNQFFYSDGLYTLSDSVETFNYEPGFTGQQTSFTECHIEWCFTHVLDTVLFRYTMASDSVDSNNEGWLIDNVYFFSILGGVEANHYSELYRIYPNPANEILIINTIGINSISRIEVYSIYGKLMSNAVSQGNYELDISYYDRGLYIIIINDNYVTKFQKL